MSTEHRPKVFRAIDPDLPDFPWRMNCFSCGAATASINWPLAIKSAGDHIQAAEYQKNLGPIDLLPLVKTRLAWDLLEHDDMNSWLPRLGLVPADPEMDEKEHAEAHKRAAAVAPLAKLAETYAAVIADIQTVYFAHESDHSADDEDQAVFTDMVFRLIRSGVFAVFAEFLSDGLLTYGPAVVAALESA